jgi:hypothetical protein
MGSAPLGYRPAARVFTRPRPEAVLAETEFLLVIIAEECLPGENVVTFRHSVRMIALWRPPNFAPKFSKHCATRRLWAIANGCYGLAIATHFHQQYLRRHAGGA